MIKTFHIIDYPRFAFESIEPEQACEINLRAEYQPSEYGFNTMVARLVKEGIPVIYRLRGKWYVIDGGFYKLADYLILDRLRLC